VFLTSDYGYNGRHDPDEERRQGKLLARKLKQEKRGAMRELRRDREFLNTMKREEFVEETAERQQSMKAIRSFLVQGQTEHKRELKDKAKAQQKMKL
jgi:nucleolar protein 14